MRLSRQSTILVTAVGFLLVGLLLGWLVIGWWLWPVRWYDADPIDLRARYQADYVKMVADSYAANHDINVARERLTGWSPEDISAMISEMVTTDMQAGRGGEAQRLTALANDLGVATVVNPAPTPAEEESGGRSVIGTVLAILGVIVALLLLLAAAAMGWAYWQRRKVERPATAPPARRPEPAPPSSAVAPAAPAAFGSFNASYNVGDDSYDECFPIETSAGDFLGECGVGISEVLGDGEPSLVTAFEVWLFDKSDIRTVTKVLMTEYAFADTELREKLSSKGEAVLAERGKTIVLETASLRLRAVINDLAYGTGDGPERSYFSKLGMVLSPTTRDVEVQRPMVARRAMAE